MGMNQKILGVYGDMNPAYIKLAGKAAEGHVIGGEYDENYNTPKNQAFKKKYEELVKKNNDPYNIMFAALHYDAASMLLAGMKKNGPTSEGILKFINEVKDFDGVTGKPPSTKTTTWSAPAPKGFMSWKSKTASMWW